jgi:hypothetical protein
MFLTPTGGSVPPGMGVLTSYAHKGTPLGIVEGAPWAADNCAFTGFDASKFYPWLESMTPYKTTCLFVAVPDVVADAAATLALWAQHAPQLTGWPLAFVAQDGQESLPLPDGFSTLFVGGSTEWKESEAAIDVIRRAQAMGARIHIGRVNWQRRYKLFRVLHGSEEWTCDGTRTRFEGSKRTHNAWVGYMAQPPLFTI